MHNDTDDCELRASENNEAATRFIVDHNKICWNKINFSLNQMAKCIPNDLRYCRC